MLLRKSATIVVVLVALNSVCAVAQTPADDALMHWQLGINNSRIERLRALAPQMMPSCRVEATDAEIADFFSFWRQTASEKVIELEKMGQPDYTSPRSIAPLEIGASVPLRELKTVGANTSGASEAAKEQIEIWHLYRCVDAEFHGTKYSGAYGYDGVLRIDNIQTTFAPVPGTQIAMMVPSMRVIEPIEALGKLFHAADERHLLNFRSDQERRYFFDRYDTDYFVNLTESDVTRRWFLNPPWSTPLKQRR